MINRHKIAKHFEFDITDTIFRFARGAAAVAAEATTDGIYVVRTSLPVEALEGTGTVRSHKSLALVEQAFCFKKTIDLHVRLIHHWSSDRIHADVCLCVLTYDVE
ncbi:MAG: hypothetical protein ACREFJ_18415 [Acetobacteraceae bacterium]